MKIAIDIEHTKRQKTGVGYYTYNLVKNLEKIDKNNFYDLVFWKIFFKQKIAPIKISSENFRNKIITLIPFKIFNRMYKFGIKIPLNMFLEKPDIFLFTNFVRYPIWGCKTISVIHDLSYLKFPEYCDKKNTFFLKKGVKDTIKKSNHIIATSESTKQDIIKYYDVNPKKITVIYQAYNKNIYSPREPSEIEKIKKKYNIKNNYFLFTGTLEPRKNIKNIIKAYVSLKKDAKKQYSLVLAGGKGWQDSEIQDLISKVKNNNENIIITGYVEEEDLPALYSGAHIFLYPSVYEGFGIPILEAMACGAPVITSNTSSMPEVAGDAAILVDPNNTEEIKVAIEKVLTNESLRKKLIEKGYKQVKRFSWEKSAKQFIKVFNEVYKNE